MEKLISILANEFSQKPEHIKNIILLLFYVRLRDVIHSVRGIRVIVKNIIISFVEEEKKDMKDILRISIFRDKPQLYTYLAQPKC